jgi:hypothetical protein
MKNPFLRTHISNLIVIASLALAPAALAVDPPPDGGYPDQNTAEGEDALFSLTSSPGNDNTAIGFNVLYHNTDGYFNTATGSRALYSNTTGHRNTANGVLALYSNATGGYNTATGMNSLYYNTTGFFNTANGVWALYSNIDGNYNTAVGYGALQDVAHHGNNTACGYRALNATRGANNIAIGSMAGFALRTGHNNIYIGHEGLAGESGTIRIGKIRKQTNTYIAGIDGVTVPGGVSVIVDSSGQLGTITSSARFKDAIKPMDKASEAILALKPVTFRYRHELDPDGIPQFGLVAEQVEKVNPDLVARDADGKAYTVRYEAVNAMLLNEFLKEHREVEKEAEINQQQEATIARLELALKAQAAQIQKVSEQLRTTSLAPRVVADN